MILRQIKYLFIGLIFVCCSAPQQVPEDQGSSPIVEARQIVNNLMLKNKTVGMAVSVYKGDKMVWSEGFGYSSREQKIPVNPAKTMFRIGSVSKTLTSASVGLLLDANKVDPDAIIQEYVPSFPNKKYPITVRQVAGHIAGIRHYRGNEFLSDKFFPDVKSGLTIFADDTLLFEPGTDYSYSSYGWNLISAVIENAAEEPFLNIMQNKVFDRLGMNNTMADLASEQIPNRTWFYIVQEDSVVEAPYVDNSYKWAGGGFIGTSEDLIKFGAAFLSSDFLTRETIEEMWQTQYLVNGDTTEYGMGWASGVDEKGKSFVGHSGGSIGGITQFWIYPKERIIVAMVSNTSPLRYGDADTEIAWLFMDE